MDFQLESVDRCPLCGDTERKEFRHVTHLNHEWNYVQCRCGMVYQRERMSNEFLIKYYEDEYRTEGTGVNVPDKQMAKRREIAFETFRAQHQVDLIAAVWRKPLIKHLDIGCAAGRLIFEVGWRWKGIIAMGVEPNDDYRSLCRLNGLEVVPALKDVDDKNFDLITISHTLEHVPGPVFFLKEAKALAAVGALIFIEVPNVHHKHGLLAHHPVAFSEITLGRACHEAGIDAKKVMRTNLPHQQDADLNIVFFGVA